MRAAIAVLVTILVIGAVLWQWNDTQTKVGRSSDDVARIARCQATPGCTP